MQYKATTPKEYLKELEPDWRKEKLNEVRRMIKSAAPELEEGISYKMLCYKQGETNVFCLNAQKNYVSLYVGNIEKVDSSGEMLKEFNRGKGCIRIKKSNDLSETQLDKFIERTIDVWREGVGDGIIKLSTNK